VYIGPKSRTERPRKKKIGTGVAHVTCDSDTTFKVKRSKVSLQGRGHIVAASRMLIYFCRCKLPIFVGIRGSVTHFSELRGNTTHFRNELKETLPQNTKISDI